MRQLLIAIIAAVVVALAFSSCAEFPRPFEPGAGGGPGPKGCIEQKERAKAKGEAPVC